jgi:hypothetical protein
LAPLSIKRREIFKVLLALLHPPIIAGLVFGADEAIGPTATIGHRIMVASRFSDRFLDMTGGARKNVRQNESGAFCPLAATTGLFDPFTLAR